MIWVTCCRASAAQRRPRMPASRPAANAPGDGRRSAQGAVLRALQPVQAEDPAERAGRKRLQIRQAAVGAFLRNGYVGTSMDDVAAAARVAKQTGDQQF